VKPTNSIVDHEVVDTSLGIIKHNFSSCHEFPEKIIENFKIKWESPLGLMLAPFG
jgi:hypothetical protein